MSKNILVKLGGTDVTDYLVKSEKTTTYGDAISEDYFEFTKNVNSVVPLSSALTVGVWQDSSTPPTTKVFNGFIDLYRPEDGLIKITAKDQLALLVNKQIMHTYDKTVIGDPAYPDGKISDIFIDIVETYGELSTSSGTPGFNERHSYDMEDGSGSTVSDNTGSEDGTWSGTPQWEAVIVHGDSYSIGPFSAANYVTIPKEACTFSSGKISFYVYFNAFTASQMLLEWKHDTGKSGHILVNPGGNAYLNIDGTRGNTTTAPFVVDTWYLVDLVWNGTTANFYVDSDLKKSWVSAKGFSNIAYNFTIGRAIYAAFTYALDGYIDDLTFYETIGTTSVIDSGTEITLNQFPCRNADPFERCKKLAETLNWVFYYKASDGLVYFQPKNQTTNSTVLTVGTNIVVLPTWEYDRSEMINDLRLEGAQQLVQATQTFKGDGSTTLFNLANIPEDLAVYYSAAKDYSTTAKVASEIKVGDIVGAISTHDYEVDKQHKTINFTGFTPADNDVKNILVESSYYAPIPIHMENSVSKATYGTYAKTIILTDVISLTDAWKRAENILNKYSEPFKSAKLIVKWTNELDVSIGQSIRVVDSINQPAVDQFFTIYKIIDSYPDNTIELHVGDKQYTIEEYQANLIERVKRLEETVIGTTAATTEIIQSTISTNLTVLSTTVTIQDINDSFIMGHTDNAVVGTNKLGDRITLNSETIYEW